MVPSQAPSDPESFASVVPILHRSSSRITAFEDERVSYIAEEFDGSMGVGDLKDRSQMPGAFPQDEAFDDDRMCAFM